MAKEKYDSKAKEPEDAEMLGNSWSDGEDSLLREHFPFSTDDELIETMSRSINSIKGRAYRLGLKKHWSFVQKVHKQNAKKRWTSEKSKRQPGKKNYKINSSAKAGKF